MALAYQSTQTASGTGTAVVTKPTSLAVGDLMVAFACGFTDSANGSITPPAGWTTKVSTVSTFGNVYSFWKIADAGDVAASNFTFTNGGSGTKFTFAAITRATGGDTTAPVDQGIAANHAGGGSTFSTGSVTPSQTNSLCFIFTASGNSGASRTVSGYAFATDNPSWTEAFDTSGVAFGSNLEFSLAYAVRNPKTATGGSSATASGAFSDFGNTITICVVPPEFIFTEVAGTPVETSLVTFLHLITGTDVAGVPVETVRKAFSPMNTPKHPTTFTNLPKS